MLMCTIMMTPSHVFRYSPALDFVVPVALSVEFPPTGGAVKTLSSYTPLKVHRYLGPDSWALIVVEVLVLLTQNSTPSTSTERSVIVQHYHLSASRVAQAHGSSPCGCVENEIDLGQEKGDKQYINIYKFETVETEKHFECSYTLVKLDS